MIRCLTRIQEHVEKNGLNIPFERLKEMALQLDRVKADSLTNAEFYEKANALINEHLRRVAEKTSAANAMILQKRQEVLKKVMDKSLGQPVWKNIAHWVGGGSTAPGWDTNRDPKVVAKAIQADLLGDFNRAIEKIKPFIESGKLDRETFQELFALSKMQKLEVSGSDKAFEFAKAIHGLYNNIFSLKKSYNPFMERLDQYITKQTHDRVKVSAVDKATWVQDAMDTFGQNSFPELRFAEKEMVMGSIYDRIKDGSYGSVTDDSESDKFITVKGPGGNIQKRMSRSRSLIANDPDSLYDYNQKYGQGNLSETMLRVIQSASKDIALLEKFGPNPKGAYEGVFQRARALSSPEDGALLDQKKRYLDRLFDTATGATDVPAQTTAGRIVQGALNLEYASKGGMALIRAQLDLANAASLVRGLNGKNVFVNGAEIGAAYAKHMATLVGAKGNPEALREAMEPLLLFSTSFRSALMDHLGGENGKPGITARIAEGIGKVSGMQAHVDALRLATGSVIANHLGKMADTPHAELSPRMQQGLLRYGIGENEWNTIRSGVMDWNALEDEIPAERRKQLDSTGVASIPDEQIADYLTRGGYYEGEPSDQAIFLARKQLQYKLGTLINEHADLAVVHGGSRQRAFMYQGTTADDPVGMILRLIMQFKGAALAQAETVKRSYYSGDGLKGDWSGTAQHVALLLLIGALGNYVRNFIKGNPPEDPTTPSFALNTAMSSGAAGLWGDSFLHAAKKDRLGDMLTEAGKGMAGPVISDGATLGLSGVELSKAETGIGKASKKEALNNMGRTAVGLVPGQNLLWSTAAFNWYMADGLKNFLGDGYLSHMIGKHK